MERCRILVRSDVGNGQSYRMIFEGQINALTILLFILATAAGGTLLGFLIWCRRVTKED
jgi:hypothetical protein